MKRRLILLILMMLSLAVLGVLLRLKPQSKVGLDSIKGLVGDVQHDVDRLGQIAVRLSDEQEIDIGRQVVSEVFRFERLSKDQPWINYVAAVGERLAAQARRKKLTYTFYVLDSSEINAYSVPGGHIFVPIGLLNFVDSEAELAAVLGHEIAHVDKRHCIERLQYEIAARKIVGNDLAQIARLGYDLFRAGFNEQKEIEADSVGLEIVAQAGYHPRGAVTVFEKLAHLEAQWKGKPTPPRTPQEEIGRALIESLDTYFRTHPPAEQRIHNVKRLMAKNGWDRGKVKFYVGKVNYQTKTPRSVNELAGEWSP